MSNRYRIFGLTVLSEVDLPSFPAPCPDAAEPPDVVIRCGPTPYGLAHPRFKGVRFETAEDEFLLRVDGVARYYVQGGRTVVVTPEEGAGDDVVVFLMGSAMGALLHQRRVLALHGGAIMANGEAVIFSGPSGVGKSVLTAAFLARGYGFLADDICAVTTADGDPAVIPGFPRLKLWEDALKKLETDRDGLERVRYGKTLEKYFLPVEVRDGLYPLRSVFALEADNSGTVEITGLTASEKIAPLMANTYRSRFIVGPGARRDHFLRCAAVAAKVAVYRTVRPKRGFLLDELLDMTESRFRG